MEECPFGPYSPHLMPGERIFFEPAALHEMLILIKRRCDAAEKRKAAKVHEKGDGIKNRIKAANYSTVGLGMC